jgi:hypothetical protein
MPSPRLNGTPQENGNGCHQDHQQPDFHPCKSSQLHPANPEIRAANAPQFMTDQ